MGPRFILNPSLSRPHANERLETDKSNYAFDIERSASALFGVVTYGIHMTIYEVDEDGIYRIWVPKRAKTKQTCVVSCRNIRDSWRMSALANQVARIS
jgi:hypothetical protein